MVCAGAEAKDVTSIINGYYYIHNNANTSKYVGTSYTCVGSLASAAMFRIQSVSYDNTTCYTIYSVDNNAYVNFVNAEPGDAKLTNGSLGANSYWDITFVSGTAATICPHGSTYSWNFYGGNKDGKFVGLYDSSDGNSKWLLNLSAIDMPTSLPAGKSLSIGSKATSITCATSASDNDHWYIITQDRIPGVSTKGESPIYNTGTQVYRAATSITPTSLTGTPISEGMKYLVRFIDAGDGLYYVQFGDGACIAYPNSDSPSNSTILTTSQWNNGAFAFTLIEGATTFSWNLSSNTGKRVDNNGAGESVVYYDAGLQTVAGGNCDWAIYPVTFSNAVLTYNFTTTDGSFYNNETNNIDDGSNFCNLWLSKAAAGKPQVKLITNDATSTGGNNMRSSGGLFTTASSGSSYRYNLSISEGRIISYTIVGTAVGALGITPAGGTKEDFAASASVSKKVTLASPAKETYFSLSGSSVWLNVEKFLIEYETDAEVVTNASAITNDGIYTISSNLAERGALYAGETYLDACGGYKSSTTKPANPHVAIDATSANQQFAIYTYGGRQYLYNIHRGKFVGAINDIYFKLNSYPTTTWSVSAGSVLGTLRFTHSDEQRLCVNAWVGAGGDKIYGVNAATPNDGADNLIIKCVGTLTSEQKTTIEGLISAYLTLDGKLQKIEQYTIGNDLGEYTNVNYATDDAKNASNTSIRTAAADYSSSEMTTATSNATTAISNMTLNMPVRPIFLRIRSTQGAKGYLTAAAAGGRATFTAATDATTIFLWASDAKLVSYNNSFAYADMYVPQDNSDNAVAYNVEAAVSGNIGQYSVTCTYKNNKTYLYSTGSGNADRNTLSESFKQRNSFTLEAVTSLPVTISAAGYATLYAPVALEIPSGVKAFAGTVNKAKSQLTMHRIEDVIPANTAVVLKLEDGTEAGTFNFNITTTESTVGENSLQGTTAAQTYADQFVLGIDTENSANIGFFKLTGSTVLPGFKAYLPSNVLSAEARSITVVWDDETTGISDASRLNDKSKMINDKQMFDLQGRRVSNPQRGLYIVNGHKIVIK